MMSFFDLGELGRWDGSFGQQQLVGGLLAPKNLDSESTICVNVL